MKAWMQLIVDHPVLKRCKVTGMGPSAKSDARVMHSSGLRIGDRHVSPASFERVRLRKGQGFLILVKTDLPEIHWCVSNHPTAGTQVL